MNIVYLLLPASLTLAAIAGFAYLWASRSGQLDDLDTPPLRMLNDDLDSEKQKSAESEKIVE